MPADKIFVLFHTIHDALKMEKALKKVGVPYELVPIPRNLSSDCGMCIRLDGDRETVKPGLGIVDIAGCYSFDGEEYKEIDLKNG